MTGPGLNGSMAVCLGCGCACDDIELRLEAERIVEARRACRLGEAWFADGAVPIRVRSGGSETSIEAAIDAAAAALADAVRPVVYLAADLSCEAQREGIAIADLLRARLASLTSSGALPSVLAAQEQGRPSATLGEIRNRADMLVFWGVDPAIRYPRYWSRYAPEPIGIYAAEGRRSRVVVAVDVGGSRGPGDADVRFHVAPEREVAMLTTLAAAVGRPLSTPDGHDGGEDWGRLAATLQSGRYVVLVADAERDDAGGGVDPARPSAVIALAQALNATTRCAVSTLRGGGNRSGADACTTSQTGYPASVDFAAGFPRYRPYDLLGDAEPPDAILMLGSADTAAAGAFRATGDARWVVIGPRATASPFAGTHIAIDTGVAGIHEGGTAVRMDEIPLPLRPWLPGPPAAATVIRQLRERVSLRPVGRAGGTAPQDRSTPRGLFEEGK